MTKTSPYLWAKMIPVLLIFLERLDLRMNKNVYNSIQITNIFVNLMLNCISVIWCTITAKALVGSFFLTPSMITDCETSMSQ